MGTSIKADFIQGIGKHGEDFIILLDIDKVFTEDELSVAEAVAEESQSVA